MTLTLDLRDPFASEVETIWRTLEADARPSYFLTWGWIENWLACLPREHAPELAVIRSGGLPIAACFLGKRRVLRHHVLPTRARFLNATGWPREDELCVEHNALLAAPSAHPRLADVIHLLPGDWDELVLPAIDLDAFLDLRAAAPTGFRVCVDRDVASPFVDLARVRAHGDYVSLLGRSTRAQLRRARRAAGELQVELARDEREAHAILDELIWLHERYWRARGDGGAFADPWILRFHRRLIARRFRRGELELLRVRDREGTLGCLYNLVANGRVLFYQSGFAHRDDPHAKPGYVCHAAAIEHAAAVGRDVYDLLGGDARYKRCLATDTTRLAWVRVHRSGLRLELEDELRRWRGLA
ncbi:MAG TPA: GNAT family N-acetyltransferase [Kofleriaceae bacterium]|nr:GNAT family N-acetyltransferase [Kofleriaceae bacterium]